MRSLRLAACLCGAALLLSACSFASDALWPSLSGDPVRQPVRVDIPPSQAELAARAKPVTAAPAAAPQMAQAGGALAQASAGQPTGTFVGTKVQQLRGDLGKLQASIAQHQADLQAIRGTTAQNAQTYFGTVAAVSARLQVGTTPGNPILQQQWNQAQSQLDQLNTDIANMNSLATRVAADSSLAAFMLETTRATYGLAGGVDEDRRQLSGLEDEVNRTVVALDRLLNELNADIQRQTSYLNNERNNLAALSVGIKNGELLGSSLANRAFPSPSGLSAAPAPSAPALASANPAADARRPLMVIRFDRPKVDYQQALYTAVSRALERRPDAAFDLVAVSPTRGNPAQVTLNSANARRNAEEVLRSLTEMGLPASRIVLSATASGQAQNTEVHIYVR
ncbi:MAG: hypothetical protein HYR63_17620 [Proteobacteria bacterium]|nr:hypothetical protein [Pseudomonadota bacterium]MBI3499380.1 hypothetical protein [Pseudomonadota bacterium]